MPIYGGVEIVVLTSGEPDPLDAFREKPAVQLDDGELAVTIVPLPQGKNDAPPIEIEE